MAEKYDPKQAAELAAAQNANMLFNIQAVQALEEKLKDKVKEPPRPTRSREREER